MSDLRLCCYLLGDAVVASNECLVHGSMGGYEYDDGNFQIPRNNC